MNEVSRVSGCRLDFGISAPSLTASCSTRSSSALQPEVAFEPYLPSFNLAPAAFPWSAAKVADVAEARKVTGRLFFDELLSMASVGWSSSLRC